MLCFVVGTTPYINTKETEAACFKEERCQQIYACETKQRPKLRGHSRADVLGFGMAEEGEGKGDPMSFKSLSWEMIIYSSEPSNASRRSPIHHPRPSIVQNTKASSFCPATQTLDHVVHHSTSPSPKPPQNKVMRSACRPSIKSRASSPGRPLLDVDQCRWGFFLCFFQGGDTSSGSLGLPRLSLGRYPTHRAASSTELQVEAWRLSFAGPGRK